MSNKTAIGILLLISCLFFVRLFIPHLSIFATQEIGINDIWDLNYPYKDFLGQKLHQNQLPLWSDHVSGGFPLLAEGQIGTFNLINLITYRLLPAEVAFNLGFILAFFICSLGVYLFAQRLRIPNFIAVWMGLIYAYSGFFITHISHFMLLQTASFFPILMWAADMVLCGKSFWGFIAFSLLLSQQIFSGFPQMVFISLFCIALYSLGKLWFKETSLIKILILISACFTGMIMSAAQILPTWELVRISQRSLGMAFSEILYYKFPVQHFLTLLYPFWFGNPQTGTYPHFNEFNGSLFWENSSYIGILPLILVLFGIIIFRKDNLKIIFGLLLFITALLMLGGSGPLYLILTIPPFSYFRFPSRYLLGFVFSVVMFAGFGLVYIYKRIGRNNLIRKSITALLIILSVVQLFSVWYPYHPIIPFSNYKKIPDTAEFILNQTHGSVFPYYANVLGFDEFAKSGSHDKKKIFEAREMLTPNINMLFNLTTTYGYNASLFPKRLTYLKQTEASYKLATDSGILQSNTIKLLNIRNTTHIVSLIPLQNKELELNKIIDLVNFPGKSVYVYRNKAVLPKYSFFTRNVNISTLEQYSRTFFDPQFDEHTVLLTENQPILPDHSSNPTFNIQVLEKSDVFTKLKIYTDSDGILMNANTYYPGWVGFVDGKKSNVFPVDLMNQGIVVSQGTHTVEFSYQPTSVKYGLLVSLLGYFTMLITICFKLINNVVLKK